MVKPPSKIKQMTPKRQKILEVAMLQLKKTRAQMDPKILDKIRSIIASNPKVMKGLGLDKMPEEGAIKTANTVKKTVDKVPKTPPKEIIPSVTPQNTSKKDEDIYNNIGGNKEGKDVKIDQEHNQEVIAKLMQLKPSEIENIKKVLTKKD